MQIAILQPSYLPWLGYFDQMARADVFVYLDDVQYTRRDWRNRNRIRTANGWMWLTVPVLSRGRFEQSIKDTRIDPSPVWKSKHLAALRHNYARAPFFDHYFNELSAVYGREHAFLAELCYDLNDYLLRALGIEVELRRASEIRVEGKKAERILSLCQAMGADQYLTGDLARDYLDAGAFERAGIELAYQNYVHPEYRQQYSGFVSHLSVLDLLFNVGPRSLEILSSGRMQAVEAAS